MCCAESVFFAPSPLEEGLEVQIRNGGRGQRAEEGHKVRLTGGALSSGKESEDEAAPIMLRFVALTCVLCLGGNFVTGQRGKQILLHI